MSLNRPLVRIEKLKSRIPGCAEVVQIGPSSVNESTGVSVKHTAGGSALLGSTILTVRLNVRTAAAWIASVVGVDGAVANGHP